MQYVRAHTSIPVPRIIHHSVEVDSGCVGSSYIIMTKVDGVALSSIWDDMEDSKREIVLRQVVKILLELASQSFDKLGILFQQESHNDLKDAWYIGPSISGPDNRIVQASLSKIFTSIVGYWLVYANTKLKIIYQYTVQRRLQDIRLWLYIYMVLALPHSYCTMTSPLNIADFPLCPGDFHSQNILIVEADTSPRISGDIDWEFSSTDGTSSFSTYPLFIVDNPSIMHTKCSGSSNIFISHA